MEHFRTTSVNLKFLLLEKLPLLPDGKSDVPTIRRGKETKKKKTTTVSPSVSMFVYMVEYIHGILYADTATEWRRRRRLNIFAV